MQTLWRKACRLLSPASYLHTWRIRVFREKRLRVEVYLPDGGDGGEHQPNRIVNVVQLVILFNLNVMQTSNHEKKKRYGDCKNTNGMGELEGSNNQPKLPFTKTIDLQYLCQMANAKCSVEWLIQAVFPFDQKH